MFTTLKQYPKLLDHIVVGAPNYERGVDWSENFLQITPSEGGRHKGVGTRNALLSLDSQNKIYLEIKTRDERQGDLVDQKAKEFLFYKRILKSQLVTYAIRPPDGVPIEKFVEKIKTFGYSEVVEGSRARPDGSIIKWKQSYNWTMPFNGILPFIVIQWEGDFHPTQQLIQGLELMQFYAYHTKPEYLLEVLQTFEIDLKVCPCEYETQSKLVAKIKNPKGEIIII